MRLARLLTILIVLGACAAATAQARKPTKPATKPPTPAPSAWRNEIFPDEVIATLTAEDGDTRLTLYCRTGSKRLGQRLVPKAAHEVRFDAEPAQKFWEVAKDVPTLIGKLAGHRRMVMRVEKVLQGVGEITFVLDGGPAALKPLVEACELPAELLTPPAAGAPAAAPAPAKAAPEERTVGAWRVREGTSSFDDKPSVVVTGGSLYVRCREGALEAYVEMGCYEGAFSKPVTVRIEFEDGTSTTHESSCSTDFRSRFILEPKPFLKQVGRHQTAKLLYTARDKPQSFTIPLKDLETALAPVRAACPFE